MAKSKQKHETVALRVTSAERRAILSAAKAAERPLSAWARDTLLAAAASPATR